LRKYVAAGCERQSLNPFAGRTPLLEFIYGSITCSYLDCLHELSAVPELLQIFITYLENSGVDLVTYGEKEEELHSLETVGISFKYSGKKRNETYVVRRWRLLRFTRGPSANDWHFWGSESMSAHFKDFWHMIEHLWEFMPGAWNQ
jgi:hypothetical protein